MKTLFPFLELFLFLLSLFSWSAATLYVDVNSANPISPYANWNTAATDMQSAVDASSNGDVALVADGVYASGGHAIFEGLTNRVAMTNAIMLRSVNGPSHRAMTERSTPCCNKSTAVVCGRRPSRRGRR